MKIAVIGMGYVGLSTAVTLAHIGHEMFGVEIDTKKLDSLKAGECPIYEEYLEGMLRHNIDAGRVKFTGKLEEALDASELAFIAVGTPTIDQWGADLRQIRAAIGQIAEYLKSNPAKNLIVIMKSTVPTHTCDTMIGHIKSIAPDAKFDMVSNPEFLREGSSVSDTLYPDRIVIGAYSKDAGDRVEELYRPIIDGKIPDSKLCPPVPDGHTLPVPVVRTDPRSSELIKYAANAFLATKISFINEIANVSEKAKANIDDIARGIGLDKRIGPKFLQAGIGYGGSCFPKDTAALTYQAESFGYSFKLLNSVIEVNQRQRMRFLYKIVDRFGFLDGICVGFLGLAFKPGTDDVRDSPGIELMRYAEAAGADVRAHDPVAIETAKAVYNPKPISGRTNAFFTDPYEMADGCDCIAIVTDWPQFKSLDWPKIKSLMKQPIIFDGRNLLEPDKMKKMGFEYYCVGRE